MTFEVQQAESGCLVLKCAGEISWEAREQLAPTVEEHLAGEECISGVVLDMASVTFVNSAGLGALLQLVQRLRGKSANLAITNASSSIARLFHAVALDRIAIIADSMEAGVAQLRDARNDDASAAQ